MSKEEKVVWDRLRKRLAECDEEIAKLQAMLKDPKNKKLVPVLQKDLEFERRLQTKLLAAVG